MLCISVDGQKDFFHTGVTVEKSRASKMAEKDCAICSGKADDTFKRFEVWSNERWRLSMSTYKAVRGFCYLEPKRHIQYITDLDGKEALEFGSVLAIVSNAIKYATNAKLVYVYIYGGHIPHLHVHLAPHKDGDIFVDDVIKSNVQLDESLSGSDDVRLLANEIEEKILQRPIFR